MKRTQIYLDVSQHKKLKHIAVDKNMTVSKLIRHIIDEYFERNFLNVSHDTNKSAKRV